jgi:ubiquinol-cytochrome c reductase iron-sulfur subunit
MGDGAVNTTRRRFLTAATSVVGAAGAVGVAVPFVGSWNPSAKAKAAGAPVKVDISKIEPGRMITVEWRGKPVFIVRRTQEQLAALEGLNDNLKDPQSAIDGSQPAYIDSIARSLKPEILVLVGLCTHLGCAPKDRFEAKVDPATGANNESWTGGFFCPCHGSRFDLAGRVFNGVPAPSNLVVPPYTYEDDNVIVVGVDQETA